MATEGPGWVGKPSVESITLPAQLALNIFLRYNENPDAEEVARYKSAHLVIEGDFPPRGVKANLRKLPGFVEFKGRADFSGSELETFHGIAWGPIFFENCAQLARITGESRFYGSVHAANTPRLRTWNHAVGGDLDITGSGMEWLGVNTMVQGKLTADRTAKLYMLEGTYAGSVSLSDSKLTEINRSARIAGPIENNPLLARQYEEIRRKSSTGKVPATRLESVGADVASGASRSHPSAAHSAKAQQK
jgi:hypothetical protein